MGERWRGRGPPFERCPSVGRSACMPAVQPRAVPWGPARCAHPARDIGGCGEVFAPRCKVGRKLLLTLATSSGGRVHGSPRRRAADAARAKVRFLLLATQRAAARLVCRPPACPHCAAARTEPARSTRAGVVHILLVDVDCPLAALKGAVRAAYVRGEVRGVVLCAAKRALAWLAVQLGATRLRRSRTVAQRRRATRAASLLAAQLLGGQVRLPASAPSAPTPAAAATSATAVQPRVVRQLLRQLLTRRRILQLLVLPRCVPRRHRRLRRPCGRAPVYWRHRARWQPLVRVRRVRRVP